MNSTQKKRKQEPEKNEFQLPNSVSLELDKINLLVANTKTGECTELFIRHYGKSDTFMSGESSLLLGLFFYRPVKREADLKDDALFVWHEGRLVYSVQLLPTSSSTAERIDVLDRTYYVFESHQLIRERTSQTFYGLFIELVNVSGASTEGALKLAPQLSMGQAFMIPSFPHGAYKDTVFFPYDVDPVMAGIKLDPKTIPQRTPLWFKFRGAVTGSKAYTLLGFWVPTKDKDPRWRYGAGEQFTSFQRANMRFGAQSEDYAAIMYMMRRPHTRLEMVGWCQAPKWLPSDWGASPDGVIVDPTMTWPGDMSSELKAYYKDKGVTDITRGALEIKSSKRSLKMDAYFIPQVYMEMICLNVMWCDLVRYCQTSFSDPVTHEWRYGHKARVYRIYRDRETEEQLLKLLKYALERQETLQELVHTDAAFIEMRAFLEKLAEALPFEEISPNTEMQCMLDNYTAEKRRLSSVQVPLPSTESLTPKKISGPYIPPEWLLQCKKNQETLEALLRNNPRGQSGKQAILKLLTAQIMFYSGALDFQLNSK